MTYKLVTATIDSLKLDEVESKLREIGIPGISVSTVKGYGTIRISTKEIGWNLTPGFKFMLRRTVCQPSYRQSQNLPQQARTTTG